MNRSYDWSPLTGWHGDPVPGDADVVSSHVTIFRQAADQAGQAASRLQGISNTGMSSDQVDKLKSRADALAGKLLLVKSRYEAASTALGRYEPVLRHGQQRSVQLLHEVAPAAAQEGRDRGDAVWLFGRLVVTQEGPDKERLKEEYGEIERRRGKNKALIEGARAELRRICEARDHAADQAKRDIDNAMSNSQLNDGIVDRVKDALGKIGAFIEKHSEAFELVGKVLGYVSVALTVLSFVCPLAAPFAVAAKWAGIACSLLGAYGQARKDGNLAGFALNAGFTLLMAGLKVKGDGKLLRFAKGAKARPGWSVAQRFMQSQRATLNHVKDALKTHPGLVRTLTSKLKIVKNQPLVSTYEVLKRSLSPRDAALLVQTGKTVVEKAVSEVGSRILKTIYPPSRPAPLTVQCVVVGTAR